MKPIFCALALASCASSPGPIITAHARGAQIYVCTAHQWVLRAPDAELTDERGAPLGKHYGGPTWEARDGSRLVGEVKEKKPAPIPGAVPWLKLVVKRQDGDGIFTSVRWIERVDTQGGVAPAGECAVPGEEQRVEYTATYHFYK